MYIWCICKELKWNKIFKLNKNIWIDEVFNLENGKEIGF